jgi:hypothetical protein
MAESFNDERAKSGLSPSASNAISGLASAGRIVPDDLLEAVAARFRCLHLGPGGRFSYSLITLKKRLNSLAR